jgi:hypothetical protein
MWLGLRKILKRLDWEVLWFGYGLNVSTKGSSDGSMAMLSGGGTSRDSVS